jgi:Big-like domain-containing protein
MPSNQLSHKPSHKPSHKRTLQLLAAFATLLLIALAVGCTGFFVNPTLTSIAVGPTATIQQNKTVHMTATGTYNDGTQKTLTSGVFWSITNGTVFATVDSKSGVVTGVSPGQATVSGSEGAVAPGTAIITVTLSGLTAIKITPVTMTIKSGSSQQYDAMGTAGGKQFDITDSVTWAVNAGSVAGVSIDPTGLLTTMSGNTGTVTVTATDPTTSIVSNTATLTIN